MAPELHSKQLLFFGGTCFLLQNQTASVRMCKKALTNFMHASGDPQKAKTARSLGLRRFQPLGL